MRRFGALLFFAGIVLCAVGGFVGCGTLFGWNGRHGVAVHDIELGKPFHMTFPATRGSHYVAGVQIVFDRAELPVKDGEVVVEAKLPLVAHFTDQAGVSVAQTTGWLDPNEPPTVLHGRGMPPSSKTELAAERLVGPWIPRSDQTGAIDVHLDEDRATPEESRARVVAARVVIYDDRTPTAVIAGFVGIGLGAFGIVVGLGTFVLGSFRASRKRRDGISGVPGV
ncbi:MAG TPA: hypothetical protein VIF62_17630 [Labilithrix sp.]